MIQMASSSQRGRALVAEAVRRTTFRMRLGEGTELMERRWSNAAALGSCMTRESRALAGRAIFTESGIVDVRRRARHCGACQRGGVGRVCPDAWARDGGYRRKKGSSRCLSSNPALAAFSTNYFFAENAANFLLNFSTRPAVSMIFC